MALMLPLPFPRGCTTRTGYLKCREVKTGFYRNKSMQTGSSGTLIGWKSGQTTFVPLWDRMEGAWLRTQVFLIWIWKNCLHKLIGLTGPITFEKLSRTQQTFGLTLIEHFWKSEINSVSFFLVCVQFCLFIREEIVNNINSHKMCRVNSIVDEKFQVHIRH